MALPIRRREQQSERPASWDPFGEIEEMHDRMGRLLQGAGGGLGDFTGAAGVWSPLVDVEETDDAWIVEADVPGVAPDDVTVEVGDSELVISGDIKERQRKGILRRQTRRTGRFDYRVSVPGDPDPDGVEASLEHGVLTVRIPKSERAKPRRVEIKGG